MINFHHITEANQQQLLKLFEENAMQGWGGTVMTRQPNYLAQQHYFGEEIPFLAEENGNIVGCYQLTKQQGFIDGQLTTLGYLNSLRVAQAYRHKIRVLKAGFQHLQQNFSLPDYCYTSIASDNYSAQRLLEKGIKGLPQYRYVGELYTLIISKQRAKQYDLWQPIVQAEQTAWVDFYNQTASQYQLAPYLTEQWLLNSQLMPLGYYQLGKLQACATVWQQLAFKQVKVAHYHPLINLLQPIYNSYAYLAKRPRLPKRYQALPQSFLAFFQSQDNSLLISLIVDALHLCNTPLLTFSLAAKHPLLHNIINMFKPFIYKTRIYRVDFKTAPIWQDNNLHLEAAIL